MMWSALTHWQVGKKCVPVIIKIQGQRLDVMNECAEFEALKRLRTKTPAGTQAATVTAMVQRILGSRSSEFSIIVDSDLSKSGKDSFKVCALLSVFLLNQ